MVTVWLCQHTVSASLKKKINHPELRQCFCCCCDHSMTLIRERSEVRFEHWKNRMTRAFRRRGAGRLVARTECSNRVCVWGNPPTELRVKIIQKGILLFGASPHSRVAPLLSNIRYFFLSTRQPTAFLCCLAADIMCSLVPLSCHAALDIKISQKYLAEIIGKLNTAVVLQLP